MGPLGIVVEHPFVHELAHVGQRAKQVGVEEFAPKRAVEAFDIGVLRRLAGLNPVQSNALLLTPFPQTGANKFRSIVGAQLHGSTMALDQARQGLHHPGGRQGEIDFDAQQLAVVIVEHVQRPKPSPIGEHVTGKIERPAHVGRCGHR